MDPDLGENGTLVYSIQPPNEFYSLNSSTGKIRTTHVMLDRENPDPREAELMRKIIIAVTDCTCPPQPHTPWRWPLTLRVLGASPADLSSLGPEAWVQEGYVMITKDAVTPTCQWRGPQGTLRGWGWLGVQGPGCSLEGTLG